MIIDRLKPGQKYGTVFENIIKEAVAVALQGDDDFFILCVGATGTGKSSLMLHAYEIYDPENCSVKFVAFDPQSFSEALKAASELPTKRFCCNDEANLSKRRAMTKFNNDMLDTYYAIRGLRIFHWWNNPSADILDKVFLERIKGVIYVLPPGRNKAAPRSYYYFHSKNLKTLLEYAGNLSLKTLSKNAKKYAYFKSWFRKYDGKMWEEYQEKKEGRMREKIDDLFQGYGTKGVKEKYEMKSGHVSKLLDCTTAAVQRWTKRAIESGEFKEGIHYNVDKYKQRVYTEEGLNYLNLNRKRFNNDFVKHEKKEK